MGGNMAFWKVLKPERGGGMGVGSKMATGFVVQHGAPPYFLRLQESYQTHQQSGDWIFKENDTEATVWNWIEAIIQEKSS